MLFISLKKMDHSTQSHLLCRGFNHPLPPLPPPSTPVVPGEESPKFICVTKFLFKTLIKAYYLCTAGIVSYEYSRLVEWWVGCVKEKHPLLPRNKVALLSSRAARAGSFRFLLLLFTAPAARGMFPEPSSSAQLSSGVHPGPASASPAARPAPGKQDARRPSRGAGLPVPSSEFRDGHRRGA